MNARGNDNAAVRPQTRRLCIVMLCTDLAEAQQVARQLTELDSGCLVTYRRAEDLISNVPTGKVALVILATQDPPAAMRQMLKWLRRQWPGCPLTVVGDEGSGPHEMAAREGGALYLTRPVAETEWSALLFHVLSGARRAGAGDSRREGEAVRKDGR